MAQRGSNRGWESCNISRGGICIWDWEARACVGEGVFRAGEAVTWAKEGVSRGRGL